MLAKLLQSCLTLCDFTDHSPPGSSVYGVLQTRVLEWVAMPSSRGSFWPRDRTLVSCSSCIAVDCLLLSHWWSPDQLILSHLPQSSLLPTQITAYFLVCILWRLLLCFVCDYSFPKVPDKSLVVPAILGSLTVMVCDSVNCSVVSDSVTPWTVACQAPLSIRFPRQEYWSGLPCPPPGNLPNPGMEPRSLALQVDSLPSELPGKPLGTLRI